MLEDLQKDFKDTETATNEVLRIKLKTYMSTYVFRHW